MAFRSVIKGVLIEIPFCVRMGGGVESALCVKGELLFDPFCSVRLPENGTIATGVLLLRLTVLRGLQGWARTDGPRAFLRRFEQCQRLAGEILSVWHGKKISPVFVSTLIREHVLVVRHRVAHVIGRTMMFRLLCRRRKWRKREVK